MKEISLKALLEAGCHFGHQTVRWNPKMRPYIFEAREGVHIFDLVKTKKGLEEAAAFLKTTAGEGGKILLVGTKRQAREHIKKMAQETNMPYVCERWMGGSLTNFDQIQRSLSKLGELKKGREDGTLAAKYTKKENVLIDREVLRLEHFFGGLNGLTDLPQAVFISDAKNEISAVREANRRAIKSVAIVDTNSDPDMIDYVIPANDDAVKSIEMITDYLTEAIKEGVKSIKSSSAKASEDKKEEK